MSRRRKKLNRCQRLVLRLRESPIRAKVWVTEAARETAFRILQVVKRIGLVLYDGAAKLQDRLYAGEMD